MTKIRITALSELRCYRVKFWKMVWSVTIDALRGKEPSGEELTRRVMDCYYFKVPVQDLPEDTKLLIMKEISKNMDLKGFRKFKA